MKNFNANNGIWKAAAALGLTFVIASTAGNMYSNQQLTSTIESLKESNIAMEQRLDELSTNIDESRTMTEQLSDTVNEKLVSAEIQVRKTDPSKIIYSSSRLYVIDTSLLTAEPMFKDDELVTDCSLKNRYYIVSTSGYWQGINILDAERFMTTGINEISASLNYNAADKESGYFAIRTNQGYDENNQLVGESITCELVDYNNECRAVGYFQSGSIKQECIKTENLLPEDYRNMIQPLSNYIDEEDYKTHYNGQEIIDLQVELNNEQTTKVYQKNTK